MNAKLSFQLKRCPSVAVTVPATGVCRRPAELLRTSPMTAPVPRFAANSLEAQWMPFTGNRDFKANPRLVVGSEGLWLTDHKGGKVIDGSSGLFCVAAG